MTGTKVATPLTHKQTQLGLQQALFTLSVEAVGGIAFARFLDAAASARTHATTASDSEFAWTKLTLCP